MKSIFRKLRGAVGTAVTWAVGWAGATFGLLSTIFFVAGGAGYWATVLPVSALAALSGFVGGTVFSVALGTVYGRRSLGELSPLRMAAWGAGAGLLAPAGLLAAALVAGVPLQTGVVVGLGLAIGGLGALTAGGTIRLAQAGDRRLGGGDTDGIGMLPSGR